MDIARLVQLLYLADSTQVPALSRPDKAKVHVPVAAFPREEGHRVVPSANYADLQDKLAALTRKAERLGLPAPKIEVLPSIMVPEVEVDRARREWRISPVLHTFHVLRADTTPVRFDGWRFVATIEHLGEDGNLLRTAGSFTGTLPTNYRTDPATCEHCGTRRRRNGTFVVQHEDGRFVRVGRNCLTAFLGDRCADDLARYAEFEKSLLDLLEASEFSEGGYSLGAHAVDPESYLTRVAQVIEKCGWISRKVAMEANKVSSADTAWAIFFAKKPEPDVAELRATLPTATHKEDAVNALAWARAIPEDTASDYLHNLRIIAGLPAITGDKKGLAAAIVMSYQKEQERLKRAEFERRLPSKFLGTVGQKFGTKKGQLPLLPARVLGVHTYDGTYGTVTIIRMQVPGGADHVHDLVWFASGDATIVIDPEAYDTFVAAEKARDDARDAFSQSGYKDVDLHRAMEDAEVHYGNVWKAGRDATRTVRAGDSIWLGGTIKRNEVSKKTQREETHMTRCTVTAREEA